MTAPALLDERARQLLDLDPSLRRHVEHHDGFVTGWWTAAPDHPSGPPLVLLHGGGAGADAIGNWFRVMPTLARRRAVAAVDLLGFGGSHHAGDGGYHQASRVAHLRSWVAHVGLSSADWIGNSMGGASIVELALGDSSLIRRLVLMGSAGLPIPVSPELHEILVYAGPDLAAMRRIVAGLTHQGFVAPSGLVEYRYDVTDDDQRMATYTATMAHVRLGDMLVDAERLGALDVPVLIVTGRDDRVVPFEAAVRFHQLLPDARLYSIPSCGHWPMLEHPEEFVRIAEAFLDAPPAPVAARRSA